MTKSKHVIISLLAFMLAVALFPFSALALTENALESAPELNLAEETDNDVYDLTPDDTDADISDAADPAAQYFSYQNRYVPERGTVSETRQLDFPRLTDQELELARKLIAAKEAGENLSFDNLHYAVPEKVTEAGVFPLNPDDFNGETFYVILPDTQMTEIQVANLIFAFDELGISFDPDSLNYKNCARGSSMEWNYASRFLTYEERDRMEAMKEQISRGIFDSEAIVPDSSCKSVSVRRPNYARKDFDAFKTFYFYPYRELTDNEMAAFALMQEKQWEVDPDILEKTARQYAHSFLKLPLDMPSSGAYRNAYDEYWIEFRNQFRPNPDTCKNLYDSYDETPEEIMVEQTIDLRTDTEVSFARVLVDYPALYDEDSSDTQTRCSLEELTAAAQQWAEKYLQIPTEDILTDWALSDDHVAEKTVTFELQTAEWIICLELLESDARYCQARFHKRSLYDDDYESFMAGVEVPSAEDIGLDVLDQSARQNILSLLKLPADLVTEETSQADDLPWFQYQSDFCLNLGEDIGSYGPVDEIPDWLRVNQQLDDNSNPYLDTLFVTYRLKSKDYEQTGSITHEEFVARARQWADKYLLIPESDIVSDWVRETNNPEIIEYKLQTSEWDIYLDMLNNGEYDRCAFYRREAD